jgi:protein-disulfide isomerase
MSRKLIGAMALILALSAGSVSAQTAVAGEGFSDKQKEQIEEVVRNLLTSKDPGLVMKAAAEYQRKQEEETNKKSTEALGKNKDKLFKNSKDPFVGNEKGDVTVVQFFDYNCGYCKKVVDPLKKVLESDKNVKFVFKEYPILAESSRTAAKAALAADKQKKYFEMHNGLMENKGALSEDVILEIAGKIPGLDKDKLKKDMASPEVDAAITESLDLGREVGARGTPTFIVGDKVVPGAMDEAEMKALIADARKAAPKK